MSLLKKQQREEAKRKQQQNSKKKASKTLAKGLMYRAQWVRKFWLFMHPRNFGSHVTVCPSVRTTE